MVTEQHPPTSPAAPAPARWRRWLVGVLREVLLPAAVLVGLLAIGVVLVEGQPLQQFLYAVF